MKEEGFPFSFLLHRGNLKCPKCGVGLGFGRDVIGKKDIVCSACKFVFSYEDGFIEYLADIAKKDGGISLLLFMPICAPIIEINRIKVRIGKTTYVPFKTLFSKVYGVDLGSSDTKPQPISFRGNTIVLDNASFTPVDITEKGFHVSSTTSQDEDALKEVSISYLASGMDSRIKQIPIWHEFLQNVADLILKKEYGVAIVESISAFDAFFDDFLSNLLREKRKYKNNVIRNIIKRTSRRDKLYYYLNYVTGNTFEDSPYNENLKRIADLRDEIVHPKEYNFDRTMLTEENSLNALRTVIESIKWINDTKR
jgi:hypothetical protein